MSNVQWFFRQTFSKPCRTCSAKWGLFGEEGGLNAKLCIYDPKMAHSCVEPHLLTYFTSKSVRAVLDKQEEGPKIAKYTGSVQSHASVEKKPVT